MHWLDRLEHASQVQSTNAWAMSAVLEHLAQSIDMSMDGFPQPKSALAHTLHIANHQDDITVL